MKRQGNIILIIVGFVLVVLIALSFYPFFSSHPFGGCKSTPEKLLINGVANCPHSANFWQYIQDDLKALP